MLGAHVFEQLDLAILHRLPHIARFLVLLSLFVGFRFLVSFVFFQDLIIVVDDDVQVGLQLHKQLLKSQENLQVLVQDFCASLLILFVVIFYCLSLLFVFELVEALVREELVDEHASTAAHRRRVPRQGLIVDS